MSTVLAPSPPSTAGLARELLAAVLAGVAAPPHPDNVDPIRFPEGMPRVPFASLPERLAAVVGDVPAFERLWSRLPADDAALLVQLLAYRVLGHEKVVLPLGPAAQVRELAETAREKLTLKTGTFDIDFLGWQADLFDLGPIGLPIRLHAHIYLILHTFLLDQYRYEGGREVWVEPGDVVIDGGGCWADTALQFAHAAGPAGRVLCFEFDPANLRLLDANLALNPELAERVEVLHHPLWDTPGVPIAFGVSGPGAKVGEGDQVIETRTIDELVARGHVDRVDFIKLDIEGSELPALRGARETLRQFKPRLAISAYHKDDDLITIPALLDELEVGYRYGLDHTTIHAEETILFAWCED
jgi:FkbM family methyltransferase